MQLLIVQQTCSHWLSGIHRYRAKFTKEHCRMRKGITRDHKPSAEPQRASRLLFLRGGSIQQQRCVPEVALKKSPLTLVTTIAGVLAVALPSALPAVAVSIAALPALTGLLAVPIPTVTTLRHAWLFKRERVNCAACGVPDATFQEFNRF